MLYVCQELTVNQWNQHELTVDQWNQQELTVNKWNQCIACST